MRQAYAKALRSIASIACLLGAPSLAGCAETNPSKVEYVREVYATKVEAFASQRIAARFDSLLSQRTQELLRLAKAGPGPELDGPILHPLFGWRVLPNMRVTFTSAEPVRGVTQSDDVRVIVNVDGAARDILVTVSESCLDGSATVRYCIDDFHYSSGKSYREHLAALTARDSTSAP